MVVVSPNYSSIYLFAGLSTTYEILLIPIYANTPLSQKSDQISLTTRRVDARYYFGLTGAFSSIMLSRKACSDSEAGLRREIRPNLGMAVIAWRSSGQRITLFGTSMRC